MITDQVHEGWHLKLLENYSKFCVAKKSVPRIPFLRDGIH